GCQITWPKGLQYDIRGCRQTPEKLMAVGSLEIERDAAFGGVVIPEGERAFRVRNVVEKRPDTAAGLAPGRGDLDNIGTEIAEELAAKLALFICELENSQASERGRRAFGAVHRSISSI